MNLKHTITVVPFQQNAKIMYRFEIITSPHKFETEYTKLNSKMGTHLNHKQEFMELFMIL